MDIRKWDTATWIAAVTAVIALVAAVAGWLQAAAAKAQVAILQKQLSNETDALHEAAGPTFIVTKSMSGYTRARQHVAQITVKQKGGPGLSDVTVTTQPNENVRGLSGNDGDNIAASIIWTGNAPGTERQLIASLETELTKPVNVVLHFESVDGATGDTWKRTETTNPTMSFQAEFPVNPANPETGS